MKHVYRNPNIAKRQVGILNARIEPLNLVFGRYSVKLRPQNLYAATLGFEDWGSLVLFSEKPPVDDTYSSIHWEKNFSIRLERKWSEELSAVAVTEVMQLITDVAANRKDNSSLDFTRFSRHLLRSKLNWRISYEASQISGGI